MRIFYYSYCFRIDRLRTTRSFDVCVYVALCNYVQTSTTFILALNSSWQRKAGLLLPSISLPREHARLLPCFYVYDAVLLFHSYYWKIWRTQNSHANTTIFKSSYFPSFKLSASKVYSSNSGTYMCVCKCEIWKAYGYICTLNMQWSPSCISALLSPTRIWEWCCVCIFT